MFFVVSQTVDTNGAFILTEKSYFTISNLNFPTMFTLSTLVSEERTFRLLWSLCFILVIIQMYGTLFNLH